MASWIWGAFKMSLGEHVDLDYGDGTAGHARWRGTVTAKAWS